jgi:sugar (pentulose or hexulose) kinase
MRDHLLAIDNGTQSVRALIFDLRGALVAKSQVYIEPYFSTQPGWAEQNPDYYWMRSARRARNCGRNRPCRGRRSPASRSPPSAPR